MSRGSTPRSRPARRRPTWTVCGSRRFDLDGNRLTELPDWFAGSAGLTGLDLLGNRLTELPEWLRGLPPSVLYVDDNYWGCPTGSARSPAAPSSVSAAAD